MTIGLTLSDEMLANVSHTVTALEMWEEICNVHQRHTLLNKLASRRDFIHCVRQMASVLQSMDVTIDDKEMAMAVLNGLPPRFGTIITALDAIGDDDPSFTFDKVRSRLLQEEKRWPILAESGRSWPILAVVFAHGYSAHAREDDWKYREAQGIGNRTFDIWCGPMLVPAWGNCSLGYLDQ